MSKYSTLAQQIITAIGGKDNVSNLAHCATRLRFNLVDSSKVNKDQLKSTKGVIGVIEGAGSLQVIIGNTVSEVYDVIIKEQLNCKTFVTNEVETESKKVVLSKNIFKNAVATISACISPLFPAIIASGLINAILTVLTKTNLVGTTSTTYQILKVAGNIAFYCMPIFCGYTASKRFNCSPILALFIAGLLMHPTIATIMSAEEAVTLFGLPVYKTSYTSTLFPIILSVWILSIVEKFVDKHLPKNFKHTVKPILVMFIMIIITFTITGPAGAFIGKTIASALLLIYNKFPSLGKIIINLAAPFLVLTGSHLALIPVSIAAFQEIGYDTFMYVAFIGMNFSQFGVSLAVALKAKNKELKEMATGTALTAITGITEPSIYGICLPLKKPFIATCLACAANGIWAVISNVKIYTMAGPSIFTYPAIYIGADGITNVIKATVAIIITLVVSFGATWLLGFKEEDYKN